MLSLTFRHVLAMKACYFEMTAACQEDGETTAVFAAYGQMSQAFSLTQCETGMFDSWLGHQFFL